MRVRFGVTRRMAELAGVDGNIIEVDAPSTLEGAVSVLATRLRTLGADALLDDDGLHSSVLVVVDGVALPPRGRARTLTGEERIELLLPIAGG